MKKQEYSCKAKVWLYPGDMAAWYFITLPKATAEKIKEKVGKSTRGFGSVPVEVVVGDTVWQTSIFPDKYSKSYLLPLKAAVRKKEGIQVDEEIEVKMRLR